MARAAPSGDGTASAGVKTVAAVIFVVAMVLVVLVLVRARPAPGAFDPRSGRPDGARGLVLTLEESGAAVVDTRDVPDPFAATRILLLEDRLDDDQRKRVLDFVDAGGVVVVADPTSSLHGGDAGSVAVEARAGRLRLDARLEANVGSGDCSVGALTDLRGVFVPDGVLLRAEPGDLRCFTDADGQGDGSVAFAIVREVGEGLIVGLGDNDAFTNRYLRYADNAGVMVALLAPDPGAQVTFLTGRGPSARVEDVGSGDETLRDLVPAWVWMSAVLGAGAFVMFAISRSARVGRIISEPLAAPIAGSELVSATGNLMERAGHSSRAGRLLLEGLHRDLCRAHGVDVGATLSALDRAVAHRSGTAPGEIELLLRTTVETPAGLVELSDTIDGVRRRVLEDPAARSSGSDPGALSDAVIDERVTSS